MRKVENIHETPHDGKPLLAAVSPVYKVLDLFGNEQTVIITKKKQKLNLFSDYGNCPKLNVSLSSEWTTYRKFKNERRGKI